MKILKVNKKMRFNEMTRSLSGISPKTLSDRLRELEKNKIIRKMIFPEIPPHVEYELTKKGEKITSCFNLESKICVHHRECIFSARR